ncbi:MAG: AarF/ABC1/UbiB kinase family protein [Candidatus Coatesbacteria bacterium]|nr:AarF/ABC1/UbiB kinase family protein [Candidatus Coatesbacteria bacterium]
MNFLSFIGLMKTIYGKKLPDLARIEKKGLLAVKIAQHYALRIDFLDDKVCAHLTKLYRHTSSIPQENIQELIRSYTDDRWLDNFTEFNKIPFASASVGQVHEARLKNGQRVVIKVIKKDFRNNFLKDIETLEKWFRFILVFYPKLKGVFDPIGILQNIKEYTLEELDLMNEIKGQEILKKIFNENREKYDLQKLCFPVYYEDLSNSNILVSNWIEGHTFDELIDSHSLDYSKLLDLFHIHGFYLFGPGTFHGDIHPGNIILNPEGNIYFVDSGAISHVSRKIKDGLFNFFDNLSLYDYEGSAYYLNKMAEKEIDDSSFKKYEQKFIELYSDFKNSTVSEVSLTKKMMETIKLAVNSGAVFEQGMFSIIKSMMYLDGMVLRCKPDAILLKDMRMFIGEFKKLVSEN